jgi:hypothetical protein
LLFRRALGRGVPATLLDGKCSGDEERGMLPRGVDMPGSLNVID